MKNFYDELDNLDKILTLIGNQEGFYISEVELMKYNYAGQRQLTFLNDENYIYKTNAPVVYRLTQKGILFISKGGFIGERKRIEFERRGNLFNSIGSPIFSLISVIIASFALYFSTIKPNNETLKCECVLTSKIIEENNHLKDSVFKLKNELKTNQLIRNPSLQPLGNRVDGLTRFH